MEMIIPIAKLGETLRKIRKEQAMSLDELADDCELSKSFLSEMERKKKYPRLETLDTISKNLGFKVAIIMIEKS